MANTKKQLTANNLVLSGRLATDSEFEQLADTMDKETDFKKLDDVF